MKRIIALFIIAVFISATVAAADCITYEGVRSDMQAKLRYGVEYDGLNAEQKAVVDDTLKQLTEAQSEILNRYIMLAYKNALMQEYPKIDEDLIGQFLSNYVGSPLIDSEYRKVKGFKIDEGGNEIKAEEADKNAIKYMRSRIEMKKGVGEGVYAESSEVQFNDADIEAEQEAIGKLVDSLQKIDFNHDIVTFRRDEWVYILKKEGKEALGAAQVPILNKETNSYEIITADSSTIRKALKRFVDNRFKSRAARKVVDEIGDDKLFMILSGYEIAYLTYLQDNPGDKSMAHSYAMSVVQTLMARLGLGQNTVLVMNRYFNDRKNNIIDSDAKVEDVTSESDVKAATVVEGEDAKPKSKVERRRRYYPYVFAGFFALFASTSAYAADQGVRYADILAREKLKLIPWYEKPLYYRPIWMPINFDDDEIDDMIAKAEFTTDDIPEELFGFEGIDREEFENEWMDVKVNSFIHDVEKKTGYELIFPDGFEYDVGEKAVVEESIDKGYVPIPQNISQLYRPNVPRFNNSTNSTNTTYNNST